MKNYSSNSVLSLFILLFSFALITSCLEIYEPEDANILGKWQLVRVEEPLKTVAPATDTIKVWVEFKENSIPPDAQTFAPNYNLFGENLINLYFSLASFDLKKRKGSIAVNNLGSTERAGPANYMAFDSYYLDKLRKATSFTINDDTLIINTTEGDMLVYVKYDSEG